MPSYYTPITDGEPGSPETFNTRFEELSDNIDDIAASAIPAIVDWTTLGGSAGSISITSISQTYKVLKLFALLRTDQAATKSTLVMTLNNDTTASNYFMRRVHAATTITTTLQTGSGTNGFDLQDLCTGASAPANYYGFLIMDIFNYTATTGRGVLYAGYCQGDTGTSSEFELHDGGGHYIGGSAVTRLDLIPGAGSFVAGSKYALYGVL